MQYTLPHTIQNCIGETLIFEKLVKEEGDKLYVKNYVQPGMGPLMHTHWLQDEALTVVTGKLAYEVKGQEVQYASPGETVVFKRGVAHRFWNAGEDILQCTGFVQPANTLVFFLSSIYAAQNKTGSARPEKFDAAYLLTKYSGEYDLEGIPLFVRRVIIPVTYLMGKLLGKYRKFNNAPAPLKRTGLTQP